MAKILVVDDEVSVREILFRRLTQCGHEVVSADGPEAAFADGNFLPFKPGAAWLAMEAEVPILPVTIRGGNRVWAQGMKYPKFGKVEIIYHPILEVPKPGKKADEDAYLEKINERLIEVIRSKVVNS